ncbi:hypothetical protein CBP51_00520 [Cellvibrio mixtus]|uniref:Uncharacterized protein n=1 Tax=Cellvibrio mixtus TaxID=39650 RepID=A0A266Q6U9_9GAMM|nr:hypothetical protein [Cellvibrio mixtus]OZY85572.1 hypothetical protein CBP51_00520 [Cellvibrio mixtus]
MNHLVKKIAVLVFMSFAVNVKAYDCTGLVGVIQISPAGVVATAVGNMHWVYLCSVSEVYNNVQPEACKAIYSTMLAAKLSNKRVVFWFSDNSNDCTNTAHPAWAPLQNWYWGPAIME